MSVMKHSLAFPPPPYPPQKITQKNVQYALRSVHVHDIKGFLGCLSGSLKKMVPVVNLDIPAFILSPFKNIFLLLQHLYSQIFSGSLY